MFRNYGEKRFKKQFPNLKQVINGTEVAFEMYGQVPLRMGSNSVYLLEPNGKKTTYTEFEVDAYHKYGLRVELNYQYIVSKFKFPIIMSIVAGMLAALIVQIILSGLGFLAYILSLLLLFAIYYFTVNRLVRSLGISAYKVVVVTQLIN